MARTSNKGRGDGDWLLIQIQTQTKIQIQTQTQKQIQHKSRIQKQMTNKDAKFKPCMDRVLWSEFWVPSAVVAFPEPHIPDAKDRKQTISTEQRSFFWEKIGKPNLMEAIGKIAFESVCLQYIWLRNWLRCFELMKDQRLWVSLANFMSSLSLWLLQRKVPKRQE